MADIYLLERACQLDDIQLFLNSSPGNNATFIYEDLNGHCVTPLHTSVKFRAVGLIRDLLSRGADVNIMNDVTGDSPLHLLCKNRRASSVGKNFYDDLFGDVSESSNGEDIDVEILNMLLEMNPMLDQMNCKGDFPISIACREIDVAKVRKLLEYDKSQAYLRSGTGHTALHEAIIHGRKDTVCALLDFGADVNITCLQEVSKGEFLELSPLHLAYKHYLRDVFDLLLKKGDKSVELGQKIHLAVFLGEKDNVIDIADTDRSINQLDLFGRSPLHIACGVKDKHMVETLLDLGATEEVKVEPEQGPFLVACETGSADVVRCLLHRGLYTEEIIQEAMDVTLAYGQTEVLRELLTFGAAGLTISNVDNVLEMACEKQNAELAKLILGYCRPKTRLVVDMKTLSNCLCMACEKGNSELAHLLVKYGGNVNARNNKHRIPLHCAMMNGHTELVSELIDLGAKVTAPFGPGHQGGRTALYLFCDRGDIDMVTLLIKGGASVDIPSDTRLGTPLNAAVYKNNLGMAKLLLDAGASVNARSPRKGWSPINSLLQSWLARVTEGQDCDPEEYFATFQLLDDYGASFNDLYADDHIQQLYVMDRYSCLRLHQMACGKLQKVNASLLTSLLQSSDMEGIVVLASSGYNVLEIVNKLRKGNPSCPLLRSLGLAVQGAYNLQCICRVSIRRHMQMAVGRVRQNVSYLPLPNPLKRYINTEI